MTQNKKPRNLFVIFGTSQGLGSALYDYAFQFKENDFLVINKNPLKEVRERTEAITIDLSSPVAPATLSRLFRFISKPSHANIYLVNNASVIQPIKPMGAADAKEFPVPFYVNVLNYSIIINEFIKRTAHLKNIEKKILNISSGAATSAHYGLALYCSTKAALERLTECVYVEQRALRQVKILAFRPGVMNTGMQALMRKSKKEDFLERDTYKKIFERNKLLSAEYVARSVYAVLQNDAYWRKAVLDIREVTQESYD